MPYTPPDFGRIIDKLRALLTELEETTAAHPTDPVLRKLVHDQRALVEQLERDAKPQVAS